MREGFARKADKLLADFFRPTPIRAMATTPMTVSIESRATGCRGFCRRKFQAELLADGILILPVTMGERRSRHDALGVGAVGRGKIAAGFHVDAHGGGSASATRYCAVLGLSAAEGRPAISKLQKSPQPLREEN